MRSVQRCLAVLFAFSRAEPALSLTQLAERAHLDPTTTLRYARRLSESRLLQRRSDGTYVLGYALLELAQICVSELDVRDLARPVMRRIRDQVNETVLLSVRSGSHRVCIEQVEGFREFRRTGGVGQAIPMHMGAPSKVLLAHLSQSEIDAYVELVAKGGVSGASPIELSVLLKDLELIRDTGFLETIDERGIGGAGLAAPIFDHTGSAVAALNVAALVSRWPDIRDQVRALVIEGAQEITRLMHGARPTS